MFRIHVLHTRRVNWQNSYVVSKKYVSIGVGTCAHNDFFKAAKHALNSAMVHFVETKTVDPSFLMGKHGSQPSKPSRTAKACRKSISKRKPVDPKEQGFRIVNVYYGIETELDIRCWNDFIHHVLSSPIGDTIEVILATQCSAVGSPEGKPSANGVSLALFNVPPAITVLPLTIPIEDHTSCSTVGNKGEFSDTALRKMQSPSQPHTVGVITLPSALSQHWTTISGRKCLAIVHLKEHITSDHVLPGLRRFLPKSQIIGAGGAFECFVWTRNEDYSSKSPNVHCNRSLGKQCNSTENVNGQKAAMTGVLIVPKVELDSIRSAETPEQSLKLHKAAKIVSGIHVIGDPLLVTSVQGRLITSLNNVHPLNALFSTTSHHHAVGQNLVLGKFIKRKRYDLPVLDTSERSSAYSRIQPSKDRIVSLSRAMINTEDDLTDRKSIEDIYPIAIRVTKNGQLESLLPIEAGDEIAILRVDSETERIRFKNMFPLHVNKVNWKPQCGEVSVNKLKPGGISIVGGPPKGKRIPNNESAMWAFACDSFISRDYSCWNMWNQLGRTSHGGHFRFQIYNGHEYHCSTSWCKMTPKNL